MNAPLTGSLVQYDAMRTALMQCATIDEAAQIRGKAAALKAYARLRDDAELEVWSQEIKLRASIRIGELVRDMERSKIVSRGRHEPPPGGKFKSDLISEAGLTAGQAYRLQKLAVSGDKNLQAAGRAGAERYLAQARVTQTPGSESGLLEAVTRAVHAAMGPDEIRRAAKDLQSEKVEAKKAARTQKEADLAAATLKASRRIGTRLYGVILADPPWRFEPFSRESGLDRAPENHYPTEPTDVIAGMRVPAADHAVCFLWATVPMLLDGLAVLQAWGFTYKSHVAWVKDRIGTGYWTRNKHELLLIGTKGDVPAPSPGTQFASVIEAPVGRHSEKPAIFAELIERMFPTLPKLEMFARAPRPGWSVWGNEADGVGRAA